MLSPDPALSPEEGLKPDGEAAADVGEPYIAQRGAKLFHSRTCTWVKRIAEPERVYFKQVVDAREAGFAACPVCEPWEPGQIASACCASTTLNGCLPGLPSGLDRASVPTRCFFVAF